MKVRHIEKFAFSCLYPLFTFMPLTSRAMPVSTTVVADVDFRTAIALIYMSAHSGSATPSNGMQCSHMPSRKGFGRDVILLYFQHISHLEVATHYSKSVSSGLNLCELPVFATCKYTSVVSIKAWPKSSFRLIIFRPASNKCVAYVWRKQ